jgi:probable rRNA maturation factor
VSEVAPLSLDLSLIANTAIDGLADEAGLRSLVHAILLAEGAAGAWGIAVALISDDELQALHLQFMGIDEPTDIMTFPYGDEMPGGDLAISVDHVLVRANEWGNSPAQEVEFLTAHGVLHLLGWHDTSPDQREAMLARQEELVRQWRSEDRA